MPAGAIDTGGASATGVEVALFTTDGELPEGMVAVGLVGLTAPARLPSPPQPESKLAMKQAEPNATSRVGSVEPDLP